MDRAMLVNRLAAAEGYVIEGAQHIETQRQIVDDLQSDGHPAAMACNLLRALEALQILYLAERDQLRKEIGESKSESAS